MKKILTVIAILAVMALTGLGTVVSKTSVREMRAKSEKKITPVAGEEMMKERNVTPQRPALRKAPETNDRNLELIYREDFSKFTAGSEDAIDSRDLAENFIYGDPFIPAEFTSEPGCWGIGVYQAGGICALNYPDYGGVFSTPEGYYGGRLLVRVRVKASIPETVFTLSICTGGIWNPFMATEDFGAYVVDPADGWTDVVFEADNNYTTNDCFVQVNASFYHPGLLIDEIEIYRDMDYVWVPRTQDAYDFTVGGFTADWGYVATADSYLISLYEENQIGDSPISGSMKMDEAAESVNGQPFGEGWIVNVASSERVMKECGMDDSDAIPFAFEGDEIIYPFNSGVYKSFSFDILPADEEVGDGAALYLYVLSEGQWKAVSMLPLDYIYDDGYSCSFDLSMIKGVFTDVKLVMTGFEEGCDIEEAPYYISNLSYETGPERELNPVILDQEVTDNWMVLDSLDPWTEYYYSVKVKAGDYVTESTPIKHALGVSAPVVTEPTNVDRDNFSFTANWQPVPKATSYQTRVFWREEIKEDNESYVLVEDSFSGNQEGTPADPKEIGNLDDYTSLDDFTETEGWIGFGNCMADGMLGCMEDEYFEGYCLFAPEAILVSTNPYYKVNMTVYADNDDVLTVMDIYSQDYVQMPVKKGFNYVEFTLKGKERSAVGMYMEDGYMFLLDDFELTQRVMKGDERLALVGSFTTAAAEEPSLNLTGDNMINGDYFYTVVALQAYYNSEARSDSSERMYVDFNQTEVESIGSSNLVKAEIGRYDIMGRGVTDRFKGVQIVRYSDGTSRKLVRK